VEASRHRNYLQRTRPARGFLGLRSTVEPSLILLPEAVVQALKSNHPQRAGKPLLSSLASFCSKPMLLMPGVQISGFWPDLLGIEVRAFNGKYTSNTIRL